MYNGSSSSHLQRLTCCFDGVSLLLKVTIILPSSFISKAMTPSGWGLNIVLRGVPVATSHTTNMESSPVSAVTMTSSLRLYAVADIWLHYIFRYWLHVLGVVFASYFHSRIWRPDWRQAWIFICDVNLLDYELHRRYESLGQATISIWEHWLCQGHHRLQNIILLA